MNQSAFFVKKIRGHNQARAIDHGDNRSVFCAFGHKLLILFNQLSFFLNQLMQVGVIDSYRWYIQVIRDYGLCFVFSLIFRKKSIDQFDSLVVALYAQIRLGNHNFFDGIKIVIAV